MNNDFVEISREIVDLIKTVGKCDKIKYDLEKDRLVIDMLYRRKNVDKFTGIASILSDCILVHLDMFCTESQSIVNFRFYPSHDRNLAIRIDVTSGEKSLWIDITLYV